MPTPGPSPAPHPAPRSAPIPGGREIPLWTTAGVPDAEVSVHPFDTADGLGLSMLRFRRRNPGPRTGSGPPPDVVLIVHGLTTSSDMFIMPEHVNLVTHLLDNGYPDVWTLDTRMSNRFPYDRIEHGWTMDDLALYDFPAALRVLRAEVGEEPRVHAVTHCLGAVSFTMALAARTVTGITSCVANSAALTPRVPAWSAVKLATFPALAEYGIALPYLDPTWAENPRFTRGWLISKLVDIVHPECDVPACHLLSLMWGSGWPALYEHRNLLDVTHRRGGDLYGATSFRYYRHVFRMVTAGRAVKYHRTPQYAELPDDYLRAAADLETPLLLMTGEHNHVFDGGNQVCFERLEHASPGLHELAVIPGYGHQDVFMGRNVHRDVFPTVLDFLKRHSG
ncbi:alpha/beta fold hydrolase [Phaeacidiphilus oryzae]|uniref:alpha/beta fold hydrolase n=1 Tax=Phaeacidiphilus oryzae TaxID=348818 RepID=UPI000A8457A4|nr:alpha/beta fold hydrolase [Phaeacidiphilus oryzae]